MTRILWAGVCRNDVLLAEAGEDAFDGEVVGLAKKLLKKKPTGGWEFQRSRKDGLRGVKFHVHEGQRQVGEWEKSDGSPELIWSFACVAESTLDEQQQKSFLEKLVYLTEPVREEDYLWREGEKLACQELFAPVLLQRMEQVEYQGRLAMVNKSVESTKEIMANNIDKMMERHEKLEDLEARSKELNIMSKQFKKRSNQIRRFEKWQNAKHGIAVGTAVTGAVAVVTVPPLVAAFL